VNFNSEIAEWARPVSRRAPHQARAAAHRCHLAAPCRVGTAALSRCRDRTPRVPTACLAFAAPLPTSPRTPRRADRRLAPLARPTAPPRPSHRVPTAAVRSRVAWTAPAVARRRLRAGEPPSPPSPVRQRRVIAARRAAPPCAAHRARRPAEVVGRASSTHAGRDPRGRGLRTRYARGPSRRRGRGPHALCVWAEREFGPVHPVKFY
jgi:hypothetical protein